MSSLDCAGLESSEVLAALYNHAKPFGLGKLSYTPEIMTKEEASGLLKSTKYFDYVKGRPIKMSFGDYPIIDTYGYDRDQPVCAKDIILALRGLTGSQCDVDNVVPPRLSSQRSRCRDSFTCKSTIEDNVSITPILVNLDSIGKCLQEFPDLSKFQTVRFKRSFCDKLKENHIPYPYDWHMFRQKNENGDYEFIGSMGGGFIVGAKDPVVESVGHEMGI
jgi:hypothetical protein